ncbi:hypothetical protein B0H14DRAFT_1578362 [Mycena olivaceomarginata]|nr:hypothetical protein B0H14DRAFT_1578362 [Mycena olivaceomarginata]
MCRPPLQLRAAPRDEYNPQTLRENTLLATPRTSQHRDGYLCAHAVGTLGRELHVHWTVSALHPRSLFLPLPVHLHPWDCTARNGGIPHRTHRFSYPPSSRAACACGVCAFQLRAAAWAKILPSSCSITAYSTSAALTTIPTRSVFIDNARAQHLCARVPRGGGGRVRTMEKKGERTARGPCMRPIVDGAG